MSNWVESGTQVSVRYSTLKKKKSDARKMIFFSDSLESDSQKAKEKGNHYPPVMIMFQDGLCPLSRLWEAAPGFIPF